MTQGGIALLAVTAADAEDPQTLRMVAGAIANLCGNGKLIYFFCRSSPSACPHHPSAFLGIVGVAPSNSI